MKIQSFRKLLPAILFAGLSLSAPAAEPASWSGIYPHLAYYNEEGECGTGAVVPWAGRLWVITYGPHLPFGSTDKLYEITPDLQLTLRPESVGGTPANRMIHRESKQLIIGPYFIDENRKVRVVSPKDMPGRLTGNARHLTDPAGKIYFATMEEGLYEVDVKSLEVKGLIKDSNPVKPGQTNEKSPATVASQLPGYHGKGLYSGHGRVIYANNGERGKAAETDPRTPSGALGEWSGEGDWKLVRRNQFTEVTGPGCIEGNAEPDKDPIWSMGWDSRSLILMVMDAGKWHAYRLPKPSHCYDGAHGWNTEWPRIREVGGKDMLMTMHGMFWSFPKTFTAANSAGIRPRSTYLKVIGDFCKWNDRLVFGCDDAAKSAFLNSKDGGNYLAPPGQSHSNLWFTSTDTPDLLGTPIGRGSVWLREDLAAGASSEPFLFAGFDRRTLHLSHKSAKTARFVLEVDVAGKGAWTQLREVDVPAGGSVRVDFSASDKGEWIRLRAETDAKSTSASFLYSDAEKRGTTPDKMFSGLAKSDSTTASAGWMRARGSNKRTMLLSACATGSKPDGSSYYELDAEMKLKPLTTPPAEAETRMGTKIMHGDLRVEPSSIVFKDLAGNQWRLPRGAAAFDKLTESGVVRIQREICTERYIFNCHGSFYELPTENAGGIAKIRPVSSHNLAISDFTSYRGLFVMTGIEPGVSSPHIIRSEDGKAAVWAGAIDDLWKLGKPTGKGGPWLESDVKAGLASDPYLFTGYDQKSIELSNKGAADASFTIQLDPTGEGDWVDYQKFDLKAGATLKHEFPEACQAYWLRVVSSIDTKASAQLEYR
ncbi:MAG: hypothetical protein MUF13_04995 [Akkermansiaceae bacterium]|nr:hypothetical protein [Akkermansiaceae bacterium]